MNHPRSTIILALAALALASCSDPASMDNTTLSAIKGNVVLYDDCGAQIADRGGVTVTARGTSIAGVTAADGNFEIPNVPQGTYTLAFTKPGYVPQVSRTVSVNASPATAGAFVFPLPSWSVGLISHVGLDAFGDTTVQMEATWDLSNLACQYLSTQTIAIFIGFTKDVSNTTYHAALDLSPPWGVTGSMWFTFGTHGVAKGTPLYVVAYPSNGVTMRVDSTTNTILHDNVGPHHSPTVEVLAP